MQRKRDGVWKRILALPLCACLLVSCSMRTVRVQNPVLSSGQEAPTVEPATQSWKSVAFIPVVSSVEVDLTTGETITGKFRSVDERELVLEQDGLLRQVSRAEIRRVFLYKGVAPRLVLKYNIRPGLSQAGFLVSLARSCASR